MQDDAGDGAGLRVFPWVWCSLAAPRDIVVGSSSLLLLFERHKKSQRTIVSPCEAAQDGFVLGFVKYRNCVSVLAGLAG